MEADTLAVFTLVIVDTTEVVTVATAPLFDVSSNISLNAGCSSAKSTSGLIFHDEYWIKTMHTLVCTLPFIINTALIAFYVSFT